MSVDTWQGHWEFPLKVTKSLKWPKNHNQPICKDDGMWSKKDIEKAEIFTSNLANTFQLHPLAVDEILLEWIIWNTK